MMPVSKSQLAENIKHNQMIKMDNVYTKELIAWRFLVCFYMVLYLLAFCDEWSMNTCLDGSCYEPYQRCDYVANCEDYFDEMNCNYDQFEHDVMTAPRDRISLVAKHFESDGMLFWGTHVTK